MHALATIQGRRIREHGSSDLDVPLQMMEVMGAKITKLHDVWNNRTIRMDNRECKLVPTMERAVASEDAATAASDRSQPVQPAGEDEGPPPLEGGLTPAKWFRKEAWLCRLGRSGVFHHHYCLHVLRATTAHTRSNRLWSVVTIHCALKRCLRRSNGSCCASYWAAK